jgi:hypothetical protein
MTRLKLAELTSGVGALVLGIGLGAWLSRWLAPAAALIVLAGVVAHSFGMWDKHRLEARASAEATDVLVVTLYWVCWVLLAGVVAVLLVWR